MSTGLLAYMHWTPQIACAKPKLFVPSTGNTTWLYYSWTNLSQGFSFVDLSDATTHSYSPCALRSIPSARGSNPMRLGSGFLFSVLSSSREPSFCNERNMGTPWLLSQTLKLPLTALFTQQTSVFGFVCSTKQKGLGTNLPSNQTWLQFLGQWPKACPFHPFIKLWTEENSPSTQS